jgi:hypothetical protein
MPGYLNFLALGDDGDRSDSSGITGPSTRRPRSWALGVPASSITLPSPIVVEDHAHGRTLTPLPTLSLRTRTELYFASSGGPLFVAVVGEDEARRRPESRRRGRGKGDGEGEESEEWQEGFWMCPQVWSNARQSELWWSVVATLLLLASAESNNDDEKDKVERERDTNDAIMLTRLVPARLHDTRRRTDEVPREAPT